jgi:hypothetical protein
MRLRRAGCQPNSNFSLGRRSRDDNGNAIVKAAPKTIVNRSQADTREDVGLGLLGSLTWMFGSVVRDATGTPGNAKGSEGQRERAVDRQYENGDVHIVASGAHASRGDNMAHPLPAKDLPATHSTAADQSRRAVIASKSASATGGIGCKLMHLWDGTISVQDVKIGGGAHEAGVKPGSRLLAVDGKDVHNLSISRIRELCKGPLGSVTYLELVPPEALRDADVATDIKKKEQHSSRFDIRSKTVKVHRRDRLIKKDENASWSLDPVSSITSLPARISDNGVRRAVTQNKEENTGEISYASGTRYSMCHHHPTALPAWSIGIRTSVCGYPPVSGCPCPFSWKRVGTCRCQPNSKFSLGRRKRADDALRQKNAIDMATPRMIVDQILRRNSSARRYAETGAYSLYCLVFATSKEFALFCAHKSCSPHNSCHCRTNKLLIPQRRVSSLSALLTSAEHGRFEFRSACHLECRSPRFACLVLHGKQSLSPHDGSR